MCAVNIGQRAPDFESPTVTAADPTPRVARNADFAGRWLILIFYPRDFSFVCPTELISFSARIDDFRRLGCELLAISVDSTELHNEWLATPADDGGLGPLQYPLASDPEGRMARAFGVWVAEKEISTRGLFVIDPEGLVQYAVVHNLSVGRNADEVLRVLHALSTGGLCPASWTRADGTLDAEGALQPGRILGHYRIRRKLGEGSFGTVFAAWDLRLERMVALKILRRSLGEARNSLLAEARAAAALNHPHVCAIHTVDMEDGLPLIAMEYVEGKTLDRLIGDGLSDSQARDLFRGVVDAMAVAHDNNIVHGDLKPANIIVSREGVPKILDFGLARIRGDYRSLEARAGQAPQQERVSTARADFDPDATAGYSDSMIGGTPAYMAPEQTTGRPGTIASDVFSLGLTVYEMLTGRRALDDDTIANATARLRSEDLSQTLPPHVDEEFRPLLAAMLRKAPEERPTMRQVGEQLGRQPV